MKVLLIFLIQLAGFSAVAQDSHELLRRIAVFPIESENSNSKLVDDVWWKIRETLTSSKRFLVASKSFLQRKDLFQPRGELTPADAIILGELTDANSIVTARFVDRDFSVFVYEARYGRLVWKHEERLHPSIPVAEQLSQVSVKLINDFVASLPYQGFVIKDALINQTLYESNGQTLLQVEIGQDSRLELGDEVQLVRVLSVDQTPLLMGGASIEVFAEGKVLEVKDGVVVVNLLRATSLDEIVPMSLVRFPKEIKRLKDLYSIKRNLKRRISPEYMSSNMMELEKETQETKPLVAALAFLFNIATVLLLAF